MYGVALLTSTLLAIAGARIYERCELARDLHTLGIRKEHIATWVCIAYHESRFDTAARNAHSGDHGLLQISELYWCGAGKACGLPCSALRDDDIFDDVQCALTIYEEHTRLQGNGFLAWVVYPHHCNHGAKKYIADCELSLKDSSYKTDERARAFDLNYAYRTVNLNLSNTVQTESYPKSDSSLPSYLSIISLLRRKFDQDYLQNSNYHSIDWSGFKIDNVDDLRLPNFNEIPSYDFLDTLTTQITTTSTTTTTQPEPQYKPVKPWRTIETNQFRRKMINNNRKFMEESKSKSKDIKNYENLHEKINDTCCLTAIPSKPNDLTHTSFNIHNSPSLNKLNLTEKLSQQKSPKLTEHSNIIKSNVETYNPWTTVLPDLNQVLPSQKAVEIFTTVKPNTFKYNSEITPTQFVTSRPLLTTTPTAHKSKSSGSMEIENTTKLLDLYTAISSYNWKTNISSVPTTPPEINWKTNKSSLPTALPANNWKTNVLNISTTPPARNWKTNISSVPSTSLETIWKTNISSVPTTSPARNWKFNISSISPIPPARNWNTNISSILTTTTRNWKLDILSASPTPSSKELTTVKPTIANLQTTKSWSFILPQYNQNHRFDKFGNGEYSTERPQIWSWRRPKSWPDNYDNITNFGKVVTIKPSTTIDITTAKTAQSTAVQFFNQSIDVILENSTVRTTPVTDYLIAKSFSKSPSVQITSEKSTTDRTTILTTPSTTKTTLSIFDLYLNPTKRPNSIYNFAFSFNSGAKVKIFSDGTTPAPQSNNISRTSNSSSTSLKHSRTIT